MSYKANKGVWVDAKAEEDTSIDTSSVKLLGDVLNAMQGKKCFDSFEAVLGDYTIGRTYNILLNCKRLYKMDKA